MLKSVSFANPASSIKSNSTTGILQIAGPAAGTTRVMTVPDANFTAARTDAAQSFTGNQTLSTGNLVIGTTGKGIDFNATPDPAGMTSELLDDYEEGTWSPTLIKNDGSISATYTSSGYYTKVGRLIHVVASISISAISSQSGNYNKVGGLPYSADTFTSYEMAGVVTKNGALNTEIVTKAMILGATEIAFGIDQSTNFPPLLTDWSTGSLTFSLMYITST